jgi:hypothetical protein
VIRGLTAFIVVVLALVAASACAQFAANGDTQSPATAEATNVRRTAIADVQRIIANNRTATPTPSPTELPAPSCRGAIWWHEARAHIGESRTVQGPVVSMRPTSNATMLIQLGQPYPDPIGFVVVAPSADLPNLQGQNVCAAGKIVRIEGMPTVRVRDAAAVKIADAKP